MTKAPERLSIANPMAGTAAPPAGAAYSGPERRGSANLAQEAKRPFSATFIWMVALTLAAGAWGAGRLKLYTAGSDLGYFMGLVGSVFMALLLLYPLRKRLRPLQRIGDLRIWFRLHMFLGVAGPVLVMYHSTLQIGSLNAAVAFYSMILVAGSGIIGRFIYTKIHHGLYGRQASLQERNARLGLEGETMKSKFSFAPKVEERLKAIEAYATDPRGTRGLGIGKLIGLAVRVRRVRWESMREVRVLVARAGTERGWDAMEIHQRVGFARRLLDSYLGALQDVSYFRTYERLFSLWHVLHVPFVWMLVICAIVHVVAVHMY